MIKRYNIFLLVLIFFLALGNCACAQYKTSVSAPSTVNKGDDYFQIKYTINTDQAKDFHAIINDFIILSGPDISVRREDMNINGRRSSRSSATFTFTLQPKAKGQFTIPSATVKVGGKSFSFKPVTIKVVDAGMGNTSQNASGHHAEKQQAQEQLRSAGSQISQKDLYVSANLQKKTVYEQEAVRLTYSFYERPGVGLNNIGLNEKPDFKGVVSQDLPIKTIEADVARVNGVAYKTGKVQEYLLFPQQVGKVVLPSLTFDCVVVQRDPLMNALDAYLNGGGVIGVNVKRSSQELTLDVKPLPSPKPNNFSGGVGQFKIESKMLNHEVRTNDLATFRVTITGTGNLKLLVAPNLVFPQDFDAYSPKLTDETKVTSNGVSGSVSFDYTFVPRKVGKYEMPGVDFVFFNPQTESYQTVTAKSFTLDVKKGTKSDSAVEYERRMRNSDIRDIDAKMVEVCIANDYFWWGTWKSYAICVVIIVLGIGSYSALKKYVSLSSDEGYKRKNKAGKVVSKRLRAADELLQQGKIREFYAELLKSLRQFLADSLSLSQNEMTTNQIVDSLKSQGVEPQTVETLRKLLQNCEFANYAPISQLGGVQNDFDESVKVVKDLEMSIKKKRK